MKPLLMSDAPIYLVDDDDLDFRMAARALSKSRVTNELVHFDSGHAVLKQLQDVAAGDATPPAMILMDINMPGIDGHETVQQIRSEAQFARIPVIAMLTSSRDPIDRDRAFASGADDFFEKPMLVEQFVDLFNAMLPCETAC